MDYSVKKPCCGFFLQGAAWAISLSDIILIIVFMIFQVVGTTNLMRESGVNHTGIVGALAFLQAFQPSALVAWCLVGVSYSLYVLYILNAYLLMKGSKQRNERLCKIYVMNIVILTILGVIVYSVLYNFSGIHEYLTVLMIAFEIYKLYSVWVIICFIREIQRVGDYNSVLQSLTDEEVYKFMNGDPKFDPHDFDSLMGEEMYSALPFNSSYLLPPDSLQIDSTEPLGKGAYGIVLKGTFMETLDNGERKERTVAVKTTKADADASYFKALLLELKVMAFLGPHENIVNLVGAVTTEIKSRKVLVVVELCEEGSIDAFFKRNKHKYLNYVANDKILPAGDRDYGLLDEINLLEDKEEDPCSIISRSFSTEDLVVWAYQICTGMEFLSSKKVIHGDLAIRNILLTSDLTAKITDFGLSRKMYNYKTYIKQSDKTPLPWRHMAIESLMKLQFSTMTDVWAYGILLWELFSLGCTPYAGLAWTSDFGEQLLKGLRPLKTETCPSEIQEIMANCWRPDPDFRPSFVLIKSWLHQLLASINPMEYDRQDGYHSFYAW